MPAIKSSQVEEENGKWTPKEPKEHKEDMGTIINMRRSQ